MCPLDAIHALKAELYMPWCFLAECSLGCGPDINSKEAVDPVNSHCCLIDLSTVTVD